MFKTVIRMIMMLGGVFVASLAADALQIDQYFGANRRYGYILLIVLGTALGYVIGGGLGRWLQKTAARAENALSRIPGWEIIIAVGGLLVGLALAALVNQPIVEVGGPQLRGLITVMVFVLLGMMGLQLAISKKQDIAKLIPGSELEGLSAGAVPKVLDTSSIIDGRVHDLVRTGFLEGRLLVPRFVVREMQQLADSEDKPKRDSGRRGLDLLGAMQRDLSSAVEIYDADYPQLTGVDDKLIQLSSEIGAALLTGDFNLNKVARVEGVKVLNINELANVLQPTVLPGEEMEVELIREGREAGQAVGYLDDGTMVVVEEAKAMVGKVAPISVTSVLRTPAGRMIFAKTVKRPGKS